MTLSKENLLACKRFFGSHAFDRIHDAIIEIHTTYGLTLNKIVATVTDNRSNFVKAFKEFGVNTPLMFLDANGNNDVEDLEEMQLEDLSTNFGGNTLPRHIRCATHTLNLLATTYVLRILKTDTSYDKHNNVMKKCSDIWNKINRPKTSEIIVSVLGSQLQYPVVTRWNSLYDSIKGLISHKEKLSTLCEKLELTKFHESDIRYLEEYLQLLQPIADAIQFLQKDNGMVYGFLLPTLATIRSKYRKMQLTQAMHYLQRVANLLEADLEKRFHKYFCLEEVNDAIVASALCPEVKLRWVRSLNPELTNEKVAEVNELVKSIVVSEFNTDTERVDNSEETNSQFFDFSFIDESTQQLELSQSSIEGEFIAYMVDKSPNIIILHRYPTIKRAYIKYNAPLPTSAPVERLFSFASLLNAPRRGRLSDDSFEKLLLLKVNNSL
ncbi:uncharacterized protein LOC118742246 [Rhagoletis pomonella]|uniref:uncharacterized protein LOC118742246 n=1 Tax=Rhagoletis pomonella TaxID=28610 RepID=UPI00177EDE91|nr:uncharacterized protein LOC118742246 [Rhagoletis pomonella]